MQAGDSQNDVATNGTERPDQWQVKLRRTNCQMRNRRRLWRGSAWQENFNGRSHSERAFDSQRAAMSLNNGVGQVQSKANTFDFSSHRLIATAKYFERIVFGRRVHANPVVGDNQAQFAFLTGHRGNRDLPAGILKFYRVGQNNEDDLFDSALIGNDRRDRFHISYLDRDFPVPRPLQHQPVASSNTVTQRNIRKREFQLAKFNCRQINNVRHHGEKIVARSIDVVDVFTLLVV